MFIAVNKPLNLSSFKVVAKVRHLSGVKKVGHAGTLDPLATGVLVIAIGRECTKQIDTYVKQVKVYETEIFLGENSTTDDREGEKTTIPNPKVPKVEEVLKVLSNFEGNIWQTPPVYSAINVNGRRAYDMARKGLMVELKSRLVYVKSIELMEYAYPKLRLRITTGKGVYIRAIARDIGEKLKTGGYMKSLIRTRVGDYSLENCVDWKDLEVWFKNANAIKTTRDE